ncbi:hypothetical protein MD484_g6208, partial [Candolleomyces efflorescens]
MSAKQAYEKPPVHLPEVPVEIWYTILRYATATPDSVEHPQLSWDASKSKLKFNSGSVKRYRESLVRSPAISVNMLIELINKVSKRYIVRVCRQWYDIAIPDLYEHVMVLKAHKLQSLLESFSSEAAPVGTGDGSRKLGELVKRIDIHLSGDFPQLGTILLQLCRSTPNLVVLITPPRFGLESLFSDETVIPRLRYLHAMATNSVEGGQAKMPLKFLASHRSLRLYTPPHFENPIQGVPPDIWASIQELIFPSRAFATFPSFVKSFISSKFPAGAFPNLHTVVFLRTESRGILDSFLNAHGRHLRTIHIRANAANPCFSRQLIETLKKCCPFLQEILYSATTRALIVDEGNQADPMPGVITVGFQPIARQLNKSERMVFFDLILQETPKYFPNVRTIRIFSEEIVSHFQRCHTKGFKGFLQSCTSLGILVEDHFREPLNCPRLLTDKPVDVESGPTRV